MKMFLALLLVAGLTFACAQRQITSPGTGKSGGEEAAGQAAGAGVGETQKIGEQNMAKVESAEIKEPKVTKLTEEERRNIFKDIHFDFNRYDIQEVDRGTLKAIAEWMLQHSTARIVVEGHCDERGTDEYNLGLGDRRATATRDYLMSLGVPKDRMQTVSYGEERPLCTDHTEDCWQQNRRAHFVVIEGE